MENFLELAKERRSVRLLQTGLWMKERWHI